MNDALSALEAQLDAIEDALDACATQDQRNQLRPSYIQAQLNYQRAVNKIFQANDPQTAQLVTQMKRAQTSLQKLTQELADFAEIVTAVSTAVRIGTDLAAMAK